MSTVAIVVCSLAAIVISMKAAARAADAESWPACLRFSLVAALAALAPLGAALWCTP